MQAGVDIDPVACSLTQGALTSRQERWLRLCDRALQRKEPTLDGVRLRFRRLASVESDLRALAELERECCSFATWSVSCAGDEIVLGVSAEGHGVAAVRDLFGALSPAPGDAARE